MLTLTPLSVYSGDMEIKNHRSGETCTLSFKPRGWRAKDSFEIKGVVKDAKGAVKWDIAGRALTASGVALAHDVADAPFSLVIGWNSQLVARKAGVGHGTLEPDAHLPTTGGAASTPHILPEYILVRRSTRPNRHREKADSPLYRRGTALEEYGQAASAL